MSRQPSTTATPRSGTSSAARTWRARSASATPRRRRWSASTGVPRALPVPARLRPALRPSPGAECSRSGSATARSASAWHAAAPTTTALDLAPGPVAMVRARLERVAGARPEQVRQGSVLDLPFADASFDHVVSIGCLHHTGDLFRAHRRDASRAAPRRALLMMVYNRRSARRVLLGPCWRAQAPVRPARRPPRRRCATSTTATPTATWRRTPTSCPSPSCAACSRDSATSASTAAASTACRSAARGLAARLMRLGPRPAGRPRSVRGRATADPARARLPLGYADGRGRRQRPQRRLLGRALRLAPRAPDRRRRRLARVARALRPRVPRPLPVPARLLAARGGRGSASCSRSGSATGRSARRWRAWAPTTTASTSPPARCG